jgi:DNA polymerase V
MDTGTPIPPGATEPAAGQCGGGESFALMVVGASMEPEFAEGEVIVIEPEGLATDGCYVIAAHDGGWIFRQLAREGGCWQLRPLNPAFPVIPIADLSSVKGVVIQKSKPGRRRASKSYL